MDASSQPPDERALRKHLADGPFQFGEFAGRWRPGTIAWPMVRIFVAAAPREGAPAEFCFQFECSGYPQVAPTARPWNCVTEQPLAFKDWPTGTSRVPAVFRPDWKDGTCLYLPCDRIAAAGHANWKTDHPSLQWDSDRGIVLYLNEVHALLNSSDYTGVRGG